jgi:hypothetical protein
MGLDPPVLANDFDLAPVPEKLISRRLSIGQCRDSCARPSQVRNLAAYTDTNRHHHRPTVQDNDRVNDVGKHLDGLRTLCRSVSASHSPHSSKSRLPNDWSVRRRRDSSTSSSTAVDIATAPRYRIIVRRQVSIGARAAAAARWNGLA